jgi:hypothetical protein
MPNASSMKVVARPALPSVNTNASASGIPAKFEATPENVMSAARRNRGNPPRITEDARRNPKIPPPIAVIALILMLFIYAVTR